MNTTVILATHNYDKVAEIRTLLKGCGSVIVGLREYPRLPEVEEDGSTLEENALIKARAAHRATGLPAIADDSGLEVDFLDGRPGIYSSRYSGPNVSYLQNNKKLLREMAAAGPGERGARFRCVAAFVDGETEICFSGTCDGTILDAPRGRDGFGYDPLFLPTGHTQSFAEMSADQKCRISHRAVAFGKMAEFLKGRFPPDGT